MKLLKKILALCLFPLLANAEAAEKLEILDIVMLFDADVAKQARTLKKMSADGVADIHMVSFFLVAEGNPPIDKFSEFESKFKRLRSEVSGDPRCRLGILIQATLGHGFPLETPNGFAHLEPFTNTQWEIASCKHTSCPLDKNFKKYISNLVGRAAALNPEVLMIDDDFRLIGFRGACICPLHLELAGKKCGRKLDRAAMLKHLAGKSEIDKQVSRAAYESVRESLLELAKEMRAAIDAVNPNLRCIMCGSPYDISYDGEIAAILAGKGNVPTLRIGNSRYQHPAPRNLYYTARQLAVQNAVAKPGKVYAEVDSYPRNRYFTSARTLYAGLAVSVLEGASGAKFWPHRFVDYEPLSGAAYCGLFTKNRGAADELYRLSKGAQYGGLADVILPEYKTLRADSDILLDDKYYWGQVCGVMGLPFKYETVGAVKSPAFLRGALAKKLSTGQLKDLLSRGAVLDGSAAVEICARGLGNLIGVEASPWSGGKISRERLRENCGEVSGRILEAPSGAARLKPISGKTEIYADFVHLPFTYADKKHAEILAPSCSFFENELGGKVAVFAGDPVWANCFNEAKKSLFVRLINKISPMPLWYVGDAECYFKAGKSSAGEDFAALVNVGLDPLDGFELGTSKKFSSAEHLRGDGAWEKIGGAVFGNGKIKIPLRAETFMPVVLRFK